jgi:hypothetical protein
MGHSNNLSTSAATSAAFATSTSDTVIEQRGETASSLLLAPELSLPAKRGTKSAQRRQSLPDALCEFQSVDAQVMSVVADHVAAMKADKLSNERHGEGERLSKVRAPDSRVYLLPLDAEGRLPVVPGDETGPTLELRPYGNGVLQVAGTTTGGVGGMDRRDHAAPTYEELNWASRLSQRDRATLREERVRFGILLSRQPGGLSGRQCVEIARDNIVARRNGYGQALPFLDCSDSCDDNAAKLDKYLAHLNMACRGADADLRRELFRCMDLACQYLIKTRWFDGASTEQMGHVANKISKAATRSTCKEALSTIAGDLDDEQIGLARAKFLSLFANAFSKHPTDMRTRGAIGRIANRLRDDLQLVRKLDARYASTLLNALSKWPGELDCRRPKAPRAASRPRSRR